MVQIGLYTYLAFKIKRFLPQKNLFFMYFVFGILLPGIDVILDYFLYNTITHSIITIGVIYLFFLVAYEIKKDSIILNKAYGFIAGIITHIILDLIIGGESINLLWPLPISNIYIWDKTLIQPIITTIFLGLEFLFFRLLATTLIEQLLDSPKENHHFIKYLSLWMKCEVYLFIIFFLCALFISEYIIFIFGIFYVPSYLMALYSIYMIRASLN